ncbi:16S rRNA (cytosine967-C5)-methyltransferase [Ligilactobacillus sp. WC1T17]|uniref:16S rRNA (cytosine(967)-C(5))-methyltransferase n=1 Tax=Ligilactobacillus ruminis TaxID=1623 RepID=A0ABY1ABM5_9LACO|nr:16S rRNA (cytosine967-C5)-methyltransferase [Ligilactobacillus ruminis]
MTENKNQNPRVLAVELLTKIERNGSYSNLALNQAIEKKQLNSLDSALLTNIVYGVIQHKLTLEFYVDHFIKNKRKVAPWVYELLKTALYQQLYLDKIPKRAIFNETIEIAKQKGHTGIRKFVTGVMHAWDRQGLPRFDELDPQKRLSIETSTPQWLVNELTQSLGNEKTRQLLATINQPPHQSVRVNLAQNTVEQAKAALLAEGFTVQNSEIAPLGLRVEGGFVPHSKAFAAGRVMMQDESAMLAVDSMQLKGQETVLDACAAPGGKTTQIAAALTTGKVYALDIHQHKVKLINANAKRAGVLDKVLAVQLDARLAGQKFVPASFDQILVDAPCSGLGLMRRKPEVKYEKKPADSQKLHQIQTAILDKIAALVKPGGKLTYSTCTILEQENQATVDAFLAQHPEFKQVKTQTTLNVKADCSQLGLTLYPDDFMSDGFFIATMIKDKS